jgi:hypothetical protein
MSHEARRQRAPFGQDRRAGYDLSTWAVLALGFLGVGGLGLRKCKRGDEIVLRWYVPELGFGP